MVWDGLQFAGDEEFGTRDPGFFDTLSDFVLNASWVRYQRQSFAMLSTKRLRSLTYLLRFGLRV